MGRLCTVCTRTDREQIDMTLLLHDRPYHQIAADFGLTVGALRDHEQTHMASSWEEAKALANTLSAQNLLTRIPAKDTPTQVSAFTHDLLLWLDRLDRIAPELVDWFIRRINKFDAERDRSREEGLTATPQPPTVATHLLHP